MRPCLLLDMARYLIVFIEIKNGGGYITLHYLQTIVNLLLVIFTRRQ